MKKTIIRGTFIALAVLAVSIGINAQSAQRYSADIPFDFEARGRQHSAGKYIVTPVSISSPGAIGLREMKSGKVRVLGFALEPGSNSWETPGTLSFLKTNGKYRLSEVATATFKLRMKVTNTNVREVGDIASVERVVIKLN